MRVLNTPNAKFDELLSGDIEVTVFAGRNKGEVYARAFNKERDTNNDLDGYNTALLRFTIPKEKRELIAMFFKL